MSNDKAYNRINDIANRNAVSYRDAFAVEVTTEIARYTPVDTGLATGNWVLSRNNPNLRPIKVFDRTNTASVVRNNAERNVRGSDLDDDIYISNAVQGVRKDGSFTGEGYIIGLENGKSRQAPNGMVLITLAKINQIARHVRRRA